MQLCFWTCAFHGMFNIFWEPFIQAKIKQTLGPIWVARLTSVCRLFSNIWCSGHFFENGRLHEEALMWFFEPISAVATKSSLYCDDDDYGNDVIDDDGQDDADDDDDGEVHLHTLGVKSRWHNCTHTAFVEYRVVFGVLGGVSKKRVFRDPIF